MQKLLSKDLDKLRYPLPCQAEYLLPRKGKSPSKKLSCIGQCYIDPTNGNLCLATKHLTKGFCFGFRRNLNTR